MTRSGVFHVNFEQISQIVLVFSLLTLNNYMAFRLQTCLIHKILDRTQIKPRLASEMSKMFVTLLIFPVDSDNLLPIFPGKGSNTSYHLSSYFQLSNYTVLQITRGKSIAKFLRTTFFTKYLRWLLLTLVTL